MNMSTTQWVKHFVFYSNSFRDNTQNKTHSRYGTHVIIIQPVLLVFISSKSLKIKPICSIFRHCLFDFHAFLVLHLRLIWVDWVPVDLKAEYREWFYRSRSAWCIQKVCIWWKQEAYMYLKHVPIPKGVILPLHLVGFIS